MSHLGFRITQSPKPMVHPHGFKPRDNLPKQPAQSSDQLATSAAIGGITAATADIATASSVEKNRTTFQASRISVRQMPINVK